MSITENEAEWDTCAMKVCEHSLEPGCFCAYCSDETRDALPEEGRLVKRVYDDLRLARAQNQPVDECPECLECAWCIVKWWCDPDFWIPFILGQVDQSGIEKKRVVRFPAGGQNGEPGHPKPVVEYQ